MDKKTLGRLERIWDIRDYWQREDTDFTPWLADEENIAILGEALGIELEVEQSEVNVGQYRADILCRNTADDTFVLIENQLAPTNHTHLGQLITYASGLDAVTLVWIVERFSEEHRSALDWLNRITDEKFYFFGLEIELWRIGESQPAPKFNVVAKPNDWSKIVKETAEGDRSPSTPWRQKQYDFWEAFRNYLVDNNSAFKAPSRSVRQWAAYGIGRGGTALVVSINQKNIRVQVQIKNKRHPTWYKSLEENREEIEIEMGAQLDWEERPNQLWSWARTTYEVDMMNQDHWGTVIQWAVAQMTKMKDIFQPRLKVL